MEIKIECLNYLQNNYLIFMTTTTLKPPQELLRELNKIIDRVEVLRKNPLSGPKEELLNEMPEDFRHLVESNYKIIYWQENKTITFASVFDCRQNPEKIKKI